MSLTNPNKPVTEARLQEFYHRIKSYLGFTEMPSEDMSEVISPLPSVQPRYHKYSTEEHIVGEWIDGKTLYEKVFNCGDNVTDGKTIALNLDNPAFVKIECFAVLGSASMPVPTIDSATNYMSFYYQSSTGNLVFRKAGTSWTQYTVYAIVQYTKSE